MPKVEEKAEGDWDLGSEEGMEWSLRDSKGGRRRTRPGPASARGASGMDLKASEQFEQWVKRSDLPVRNIAIQSTV